MNATSLNALRQTQPQRDPQDEKMEQIRDLLVGDLLRRTDQRLDALDARIGDLETSIGSRLSALHARLEALAGEVGADRRATFDELAQSVLELGDRIRKISRE
ncbi:MAG: hypothetical protein KDJ37_09900 [Hyphomicrobiaceae bacterium]|nr:hypothetical protein [Hyphomicrobiaceae bacterium]